ALSSASLTPRRPPSSPLFPYTTLFRSTGLDLEGLPVAALLGRSLVVPLAPPWPSRMFFPPLHRRHDSTHGRQGTRAGAHHAQAPQGQDGRLGLAQLGPMPHESVPPWVHTGMAMHGFPPWHRGFLSPPQDAIQREAMPCLTKTYPYKRASPRQGSAWGTNNARAPQAWQTKTNGPSSSHC